MSASYDLVYTILFFADELLLCAAFVEAEGSISILFEGLFVFAYLSSREFDRRFLVELDSVFDLLLLVDEDEAFVVAAVRPFFCEVDTGA